jgi:DHA3 family macrolide efflux protein-like MFS transporter
MSSLRQKISALKSWEKTVILFLVGQGISQLGSSLVQFAMIIFIAGQTRSAMMVSLMTVASFVPQLIVAVFSGVWADRFERKRIVILADGGIALVTLGVAIAFLLGFKNPWLVIFVAAVRSLGGGIQGPAVTAMIPQMVPPNQLVRINGIQTTIGNLVQFASPGLGGICLAIMPIYGVFFIDVVTAAIAIVILFLIKIPAYRTWSKEDSVPVDGTIEKTAEPEIDSQFSSLKSGFAYIRSNLMIYRLMMIYGGFMVLLAPTITLMPLYIQDNFGNEEWRVSIVQTLLFAGLVIGGLIVSWIGKFKNKLRVIQFAGFSLALMTIAFGFVGAFKNPIFVLFGAVALISGIIVPFYTTNVTVLLQEEVDPGFHGRVFAVLYMIGSAAIPLGAVLFAPLQSLVPVEGIYFTTGSLQVLLVLISHFIVPSTTSEKKESVFVPAEDVALTSDKEETAPQTALSGSTKKHKKDAKDGCKGAFCKKDNRPDRGGTKTYLPDLNE